MSTTKNTKIAPSSYQFEIVSVQWEYEDMLPASMTDDEYDYLFDKSEVKSGVRMFPYISTYSDINGIETRHYLGA